MKKIYLKVLGSPLTQKQWSYPLLSPPGHLGNFSESFDGILKSKIVPPTSATPDGICLSSVGRYWLAFIVTTCSPRPLAPVFSPAKYFKSLVLVKKNHYCKQIAAAVF